jgi:DNA-binding NtrC family response regulator
LAGKICLAEQRHSWRRNREATGGASLRLMVIGPAGGHLATAARIAAANRAAVNHVDGIETALALLRSGGADLLMADVAIDIRRLAARLDAAGFQAPIVACGTQGGTATAVGAILAGAKEYIPLPEALAAIAAILAAIADDDQESSAGSPAWSTGRPPASFFEGRGGRPRSGEESKAKAAHATLAADAVAHALVGRTVADVERDLILETLKRCLGNRTHAASMLGISIRTLRNKLTVYAAEGASVPQPNNGEIRGAA